MASSSLAPTPRAEVEGPIKQQAVKKMRQVQLVEHGVNLDVLGRALIAQADERIKWHKQTAAVMAAELKAMPPDAAPDTANEWRQRMQNIVRTRRYRLGLTDMSLLEITPKDYYC